MTQLVNQPTNWPTRKLGAVILVTFVIQGVLGVAEYFMPGIRHSIPAEEWIALAVPVVVAWFVPDRAVVVKDTA